MRVKLNPTQKKIIKKLSNIQVESLIGVSRQQRSIYIDLRKLGLKVKKRNINKIISSQLDTFNDLISNPEKLFLLDDLNLSIIKHLLLNFENRDEFREDKANLWHKIFLNDHIKQNLN